MSLAAEARFVFEQQAESGRAVQMIQGQVVSATWERQGNTWKARLIGPSTWQALWTKADRVAQPPRQSASATSTSSDCASAPKTGATAEVITMRDVVAFARSESAAGGPKLKPERHGYLLVPARILVTLKQLEDSVNAVAADHGNTGKQIDAKRRSDPDSQFIRTTEWRLIRAAHLRIEPHCVHCAALGYKNNRATDVDHITPPRGNSTKQRDPRNLQSLCKAHHASKTLHQACGGKLLLGYNERGLPI